VESISLEKIYMLATFWSVFYVIFWIHPKILEGLKIGLVGVGVDVEMEAEMEMEAEVVGEEEEEAAAQFE